MGDQTNANPKEGTIKFANGTFMGFDGNKWVNLSPQEKYILGPSNIVTDGSISTTVNGFLVTGLAAANAICRADFPNEPTAHFYHVDEIEKVVAYGNIGNFSPSNTNYWTMASVFRIDSNTSYYQTNTVSNNCYNFLSNGGNLFERGTTVRITFATPYAGQLLGYQVNLSQETTCNQNLRMICGR